MIIRTLMVGVLSLDTLDFTRLTIINRLHTAGIEIPLDMILLDEEQDYQNIT